jgi:hypothetical protein
MFTDANSANNTAKDLLSILLPEYGLDVWGIKLTLIEEEEEKKGN